jgi:hypothetical protein
MVGRDKHNNNDSNINIINNVSPSIKISVDTLIGYESDTHPCAFQDIY